MKSQSRNDLVAAILMTVVGVLFLVLEAGKLISIAMTVFAALLLIQAVLDIIAKQYVMAVIKGVIGVVIIVLGWVLVDIATIIFAIVLAIFGCLQLIEAIKAFPKMKNVLAKVLGFVKPVFCLAIAFCFFFYAGQTLSWIVILAGIFFIVQGVLSLVNCLAARK